MVGLAGEDAFFTLQLNISNLEIWVVVGMMQISNSGGKTVPIVKQQIGHLQRTTMSSKKVKFALGASQR